jgi:hypothetical protein
VVVEGPEVSGVGVFEGDKKQSAGPRAASLAAKINNAARIAKEWAESKDERAAVIRADLQALEAQVVGEEEKAILEEKLSQLSEVSRTKYFS